VPVAEEDTTVAVRVTLSPAYGEVGEAVRVVVVAVRLGAVLVMLTALDVLVA